MVMSLTGNLKHDDISMPLEDSCIHTGHGAIDGNSWGQPHMIDE